jgi:MerR family transcriptional regulator/heat shock protein HspR
VPASGELVLLDVGSIGRSSGRFAMTRRIISRELVARHLAISPQALVRYERLGLVHATMEGHEEGYEPSQVRRLWTIMTFQRDMGVNLAGVEVILRLCDRMSELHHRLGDLASDLRQIVREDDQVGSSAQ